MSAASQPVLPVALGRPGDHLVAAADGSPVWPLSDPEDVAAVERITALCGAALSWIGATEWASGPPARDGDVVALGAAFREPARLHAHLTGRGVRHADDPASLFRGRRPDVLVTGPDAMTPELLDWLYGDDDEGGSAPGLVCAEPGSSIFRQVLVRTAAATLCGTKPGVLREVFPTLHVSSGRNGPVEVAGGAACAAERRRMVTREADVLTVMTHSDGVDAFLGPGLSLCAMAAADGDRPGRAAAPRCVLTGFCHRHGLPVGETLASGVVLPPEALAARVLVWDVCFGVMPAGSVVDPRWGIGQRLIASASVGALLTNWQIILGSPEQAALLGRDIAAGTAVGVALRRFNRRLPRRGRSHRMCLFGDPRVRLPARMLLPAPLQTPADAGRRERPVSACGATIGPSLLELAMAEAARAGPADPHAVLARRALAAAVEVDRHPARDRAAAAPRAMMREAVLRYALSRGKMLESWLPLTRNLRPTVSRACPACGRQADAIRADLRPAVARARRLLFCAICGLLEDVPDRLAIDIALDHRTLTLCVPSLPRVLLAADAAAVGILVASSDGADGVRLDWPRDSDGTLAAFCALPPRLPPGPLRLSLFLVWDTDVAVFSRMMRDHGWAGEREGDRPEQPARPGG